MGDDYFGDMDGLDDHYSDLSNDFQEDQADDSSGWYEDEDPLIDDADDAMFTNTPDNEEDRAFDRAEAVVFGSMILGNAYEAVLDQNQINKKVKKK